MGRYSADRAGGATDRGYYGGPQFDPNLNDPNITPSPIPEGTPDTRVILNDPGIANRDPYANDFQGNFPDPRDASWYNNSFYDGFSGFGFAPPTGLAGSWQGPTVIPSVFNAQGYPYAQAVNNPTDPVGLRHVQSHLNPNFWRGGVIRRLPARGYWQGGNPYADTSPGFYGPQQKAYSPYLSQKIYRLGRRPWSPQNYFTGGVVGFRPWPGTPEPMVMHWRGRGMQSTAPFGNKTINTPVVPANSSPTNSAGSSPNNVPPNAISNQPTSAAGYINSGMTDTSPATDTQTGNFSPNEVVFNPKQLAAVSVPKSKKNKLLPSQVKAIYAAKKATS